MMIKVMTLWISFIFLSYHITLFILKLNSLLSHCMSVPLNHDAVMKASTNIEQHLPKDDETLVSKSSLSFIASQYPSKPTEGISLLQFIFI